MTRLTLISLLLASAAAAETRRILPATYYNSFHHRHAVLARIGAGDIISTRTIDASGRDENGKVVAESSNPETGPFYIEGAEPGDAIAVTFRKIAMNRNWGYSNYRLGVFSLAPGSIEGLYPNRYKDDVVLPGRFEDQRVGSAGHETVGVNRIPIGDENVDLVRVGWERAHRIGFAR